MASRNFDPSSRSYPGLIVLVNKTTTLFTILLTVAASLLSRKLFNSDLARSHAARITGFFDKLSFSIKSMYVITSLIASSFFAAIEVKSFEPPPNIGLVKYPIYISYIKKRIIYLYNSFTFIK